MEPARRQDEAGVLLGAMAANLLAAHPPGYWAAGVRAR